VAHDADGGGAAGNADADAGKVDAQFAAMIVADQPVENQR
jgi:hypothetical protein